MNNAFNRVPTFGTAPVSGFLTAEDKFFPGEEAAVRAEIERIGVYLSKHYINGNLDAGLIACKDDLVTLLNRLDEVSTPITRDNQTDIAPKRFVDPSVEG